MVSVAAWQKSKRMRDYVTVRLMNVWRRQGSVTGVLRMMSIVLESRLGFKQVTGFGTKRTAQRKRR